MFSAKIERGSKIQSLITLPLYHGDYMQHKFSNMPGSKFDTFKLFHFQHQVKQSLIFLHVHFLGHFFHFLR